MKPFTFCREPASALAMEYVSGKQCFRKTQIISGKYEMISTLVRSFWRSSMMFQENMRQAKSTGIRCFRKTYIRLSQHEIHVSGKHAQGQASRNYTLQENIRLANVKAEVTLRLRSGTEAEAGLILKV